jgi:hypothetical protein
MESTKEVEFGWVGMISSQREWTGEMDQEHLR